MFYQAEHFGKNDYFCKEYGEDFSFPLHIHSSFEFVTMLEGEMEIIIDNKMYNVKSGEGVLIFPNQRHTLKTAGKHVLCIFAPDMVKSFATKNSGKIPADNLFLVDEYLVDILNNIEDSTQIIEKKGFLYLLCAGFEKNAEYTEPEYANNDILYGIFKFVEDNFKTDCNLSIAALKLGISYSYLSRYFKKITGMSYNNYLNSYRISKACYLLHNTNLSVLECAYEVGYDSLRSFNRNFKLLTNTTPKNYKNQE